MKTAYIHCFSGVSGDMFLGSLLDLGADINVFKDSIKTLAIDGWDIKVSCVQKSGISGCNVNVITDEDHHHRHLQDIERIIEDGKLPDKVKERSLAVFHSLAEAEATVHGCSPEEVHFHEVGAKDAIIDITGTCLLIDMLGIEKIYASELHLGTGFTKSAHGKIPVPAPATLKIIEGLPAYSTGIKAELVTPTGAALIKELAEEFGPMPKMSIEKVGYGAGSRDLEIPNLLRIVVGEEYAQNETEDTMKILEANIDDMNPEHYNYAMEKLFDAGALDVYLTPIYMKKGRPATKITVISPGHIIDNILKVLFNETTTFGVRSYTVERNKLKRQFTTVTTGWGQIRVKLGYHNGKLCTISPESDDCKNIAQKSGLPLKQIYHLTQTHFS